MKLSFLLLMICHSQFLTPVHDVPMATFHIYQSDQTIKMDMTFDSRDLSEALQINDDQISLKSIKAYLDSHTKFLFNNKNSPFRISTFKIVKDHIKIKGYFELKLEKVTHLIIENTCLNGIKNHSNIIQLDLNNLSRDFRMHVGRTTLRLEY